MSDVDVVTGGSGFGGVVVAAGFTPTPTPDSAGGVGGVSGGPFITVDVVDSAGVVIGCVAVADNDSTAAAGADGLVEQFGPAAAAVLGGVVQPGQPVGSAGELATRFETPTTVETWVTPTGDTAVILITATDRRAETTTDTSAGGPRSSGSGGLDKLVNVALDVSVELGRTKVTLADVLDYDVGSVVELDRAAGAPVDVRVNDTLLAQGEVVLIDDEYAVRITAIIEPHQT